MYKYKMDALLPEMNLYGNYSYLDSGFNDPFFIESLSLSHTSSIVDNNGKSLPARISSSAHKASKSRKSPPKHRHDGTSPLPLGMDWSPSPRVWDGHDTIWPHDSHTGWSYCATIPSWTISFRPRGSATVVFYRVQIGVQSPDGFTTTREILRRFSDFLKLSSKNVADVKSSISGVPSIQFSNSSDVSLLAGSSSVASDCGNDSAYGTPELGSPTVGMSQFHELDNAAFYQGFTHPGEVISEDARLKHRDSKPMKDSEKGNQEKHLKMPSTGVETDVSTKRVIDSAYVKQTLETDICTEKISDISNFLKLEPLRNTSHDPAEGADFSGLNTPASSNLQFPDHLEVVIQLDEKNKLNRILSTMQLRLATAKTDIEDLLSRLNQELAVRQYLATKVKDLEIELDSLKLSGKENLQQAVLTEREKLTQMLWDMEELRRKCVEMELKLTSEQADKIRMESTQRIIVQENERLYQELDAAQQQINSLQKHHLELESKSNTDVKLLVKEVKSLRSSHTELKQELSKLAKEKAEVEMILQEERQSREHAAAANIKLLHEYEILRSRLEECRVSFLIEEENKLVLDASSPSDAIDILSTSDSRIGLLLAEAQLLAQDVETTIAGRNLDGENSETAVDELRKQLADVYVDNAKLRKQMNSVIRYALQTASSSEDNEEESPSTKTALTNG